MPRFHAEALFGALEDDGDDTTSAPLQLRPLPNRRREIDDVKAHDTLPPVEHTQSSATILNRPVDSETQAERARRLQVKNRRKFYLDTHPEYFSSDLELADPLLYDRLVRRYQSAPEREAEGRKKGFSGILEADIVRSEAKMEALANPENTTLFNYKRGPNGEILAEEQDEAPVGKDEALSQWREAMEWRFLSGEDRDFDYKAVDDNEGMDDRRQMERDEEDAYFDSEEPVDHAEDGSSLKGETGIQDF